MNIGLFPQTRKVLIEKFISKKTCENGFFRISFYYKNHIERFIADGVSIPVMKMNDTYIGRFQEWGALRCRIIECEGPNNGEHFSKWINAHMFGEHHKNYAHSRACNIILERLYDDFYEVGPDRWILYGCLPVSIDIEGISTIFEIQPNHCEFTQIVP
jgi:hypothetical protein